MLQNLMSRFSLICFLCTKTSLRGTHLSAYEQVLNLHQDTRSLEVLKAIKQVRLGCLNPRRYFNAIMSLSLKVMWQSCLKNKM